MKKSSKEHWAVGVAGIGLLVSWSLLAWWWIKPMADWSVSIQSSGSEYDLPGVIEAPVAEQVRWPAPKPMKRGPDWIYDVFTPPEIFYDELSGQFRLKPPSRDVADSVADEAAKGSEPLRLEGVERGLFPLQLIGFMGEPGRYRGTFENRVTHETLLLREGAMIDSLGMKVRILRVEEIEREIPESMTVRERLAVAVVVDLGNGTEKVLRQGEPSHTSDLIARVRLGKSGENVVRMEEGEAVTLGETQFRITKIRLAPPEVDVTKEKASGDLMETLTLRLPTPEESTDDEQSE